MCQIHYSPELEELFSLCKNNYGTNNTNGHISNWSIGGIKNILQCEQTLSAMQLYGVSDYELYSLFILIGNKPYYLQWSCIDQNQENAFTTKCKAYLDSLLQKTPKTKEKVLYRQDNYTCISQLKDLLEHNKPYVHPCYMTCSTDDFDHGHIKFIITPLGNGKTKAHEIYVIYNHGDERQVEFELGTKFRIDRIVDSSVYMHEIE